MSLVASLADVERTLDCDRCRGLLRAVAPRGLTLAHEGRAVAFLGGSQELLAEHLGGDGTSTNRTCPDCFRQACLAVEPSGRPARSGVGWWELERGGLGPLVEGCRTCAPLVRAAVEGPRHLWLGARPELVQLPLAHWDAIAARFHVGRAGGVARCDECGREARLLRHASWPVSLGLRAAPVAARSRRPTLDCARCEGYVASEDFPEVHRAHVVVRVEPEPVFGAPTSVGAGRYSITSWVCPDCARPIDLEDSGHGWDVRVPLLRPAGGKRKDKPLR